MAKVISRFLFWVMLVSSVGILGMTIYNLITNKDPGWLQFGLVAAILSTAISTSDFPLLKGKRKLIISAILVVIALSLFTIEIVLSVSA